MANSEACGTSNKREPAGNNEINARDDADFTKTQEQNYRDIQSLRH